MLWAAAGNEDFSYVAALVQSSAKGGHAHMWLDHEATQACGHACMLCLVSVFPKASVAGLARTGDCRRNCRGPGQADIGRIAYVFALG